MLEHELDNQIFNQTKIFFKDLAICYQIQFVFKKLSSSYGSIYFSYFIQNSNQITIRFQEGFPFDHFYLTRNGDLPFYAEQFFYEQYYTSYEMVELEYPMQTKCINYKELYKNCSNQFECFQVFSKLLLKLTNFKNFKNHSFLGMPIP